MPQDATLAEVLHELRAMREMLHAHIQREDTTLPKIIDGVPGGDWEAHKRYHESLIQRNEWKAKLYQDLVAHLLKWGSVGVITMLGAWAAWTIKHWMERTP